MFVANTSFDCFIAKPTYIIYTIYVEFMRVLGLKKFGKITVLNALATTVIILATSLILGFLAKNSLFINFIKDAENKSFDYRQEIISHKRNNFTAKENIAVITIDDVSFEYLWDKYGEWPIPRSVYADLITYLETYKPKSIIFDLLFIKSLKSSADADLKLINTVNKYDNIYMALNFDNIPADARTPQALPDKLKINIEKSDKANISMENMTFTNCRTILSGLLNGKANVGTANANRSTDGIIRSVSPFALYQGSYYPHLTLLASDKFLNDTKTKNFVINDKSELILGDRKIPLNENGEAILNWYGDAGEVFYTIPMYKVLLNMKENKKDFNLENKTIYIGTSATSLHDTKSVPVSKLYPGVEIHATFLNNFIENSFIKKSPVITNSLIIIGLALATLIIVFASASAIFSTLSTITLLLGYTFITYYVMYLSNIWLPLILPILTSVLVFALAYIIKYIIKSRDFEYQYKLATVDGLTELYNHRYFQETLKQQMETAKRYGNNVSLIIVDIDFFKKFNDTYGHQAGDAVLRQVAQVLKKNVRTSDVVCRYGGEEMSIILPNTNYKEARINAERICKAVAEKPFKLNATDESHVTISLGVATFPEHGTEPKNLIETADQGLYRAKENGRNQVGAGE